MPLSNGPLRHVVVAAEAGEARLAGLPGANERVDGVSLLEHANVARVQLDEVHMVGFKSPEAAVDGVLDRLPRPTLARSVRNGMPRLRRQHVLVPTMRNRLAYEGFRVGVTCRCIEEVDAVVQGFVQDSRGSGYVAAHPVLA